ncbi:MAG: hypothetical protein JNJ48_04460 [Phycisphaerae bacterium]|nr:hypothetical protein [Phycisphaerae bacterium]
MGSHGRWGLVGAAGRIVGEGFGAEPALKADQVGERTPSAFERLDGRGLGEATVLRLIDGAAEAGLEPLARQVER